MDCGEVAKPIGEGGVGKLCLPLEGLTMVIVSDQSETDGNISDLVEDNILVDEVLCK